MKEWIKEYLLFLLYGVTFLILIHLILASIPMWDCGYHLQNWSCRLPPFN